MAHAAAIEYIGIISYETELSEGGPCGMPLAIPNRRWINADQVSFVIRRPGSGFQWRRTPDEVLWSWVDTVSIVEFGNVFKILLITDIEGSCQGI